MSEQKLEKHTEFETKYATDIELLFPFKDLVEKLPGLVRFLYAQGPDFYFSNPNTPMGRYRRSQFPMDNGKHFAQWTVKQKPEGAKNSVKRAEPNWRLDDVEPSEVYKMADLLGFKPNFKVYKACHIYYFQDATLVFYTLREEGLNSYDHYIEIEVNEETIDQFTEEQAWDVITKYEKYLAPVGVSPQKRIRRNLSEIYCKNL